MYRRTLIAIIEALNKAETRLVIFLSILMLVQVVLIIIGIATDQIDWIWKATNGE